MSKNYVVYWCCACSYGSVCLEGCPACDRCGLENLRLMDETEATAYLDARDGYTQEDD
jgi:hypothetical protein